MSPLICPCPVCGGRDTSPLLTLPHQPVFQHPIIDPDRIPPPHFKDLVFWFCRGCGHLFQGAIDHALLARIYREYYYTPRPATVGNTFQDHFLSVMDDCFQSLAALRSRHRIHCIRRILEIGCSAGELLKKVDVRYPGLELVGVEPNAVTAEQAAAEGFKVYRTFFTRSTAADIPGRFDLIFHRNVVEHIGDFSDFFAAHDQVSHNGTVLAVETPCLDWAVQHNRLAAFHVEHIHLFSVLSLKTVLARYGWYVKTWQVTAAGYLIAVCDRHDSDLSVPWVATPVTLQSWITRIGRRINRALDGRRLVLWGAGSGGIKLINYFGLTPEALLDANPAKAGKRFAGYGHLAIQPAADWVEQHRHTGRSWLMMVSSSYSGEIMQQLTKAGWQGGVIHPWTM